MTRPRWLFRCLHPACLLLLLAGCAGARSAAAPDACSVRKVAQVPLGLEQGHATIPATIGDKPVTMLVDTGAELTLVTPDAVAALALQPDPHARTTIHGIGGTIVTQNAKLQSFGVGGLVMLNQSEAVGPLSVAAGPSFLAAGLIGADWLGDFDVDLDLPSGQMSLYKVQGCQDDHVPWQGPRTAVEAFRFGRGILLVKLALDGVPLTAILDSGANRSVLSEEAAARAGLTADTLSHDPGGRSTGVDGTVQLMHLHRFATLDVGTDRTQGQQVVVAPLRTPQGVDMLLGLDWLRRHRIWIDYRDRKVFIQPPGPAT